MYKSFIRPVLFNFDPEKVHHFTFNTLKFAMNLPGAGAIARGLYKVSDPVLEREEFGIKFPSPVGLAAGFDKEAKVVDEFSNFGFGFIEIGTLTPKGQPGNPKPRIFRLKADNGLINRMGFNNEGVKEAVERLKKRKSNVIVGGNIGKNKVTPNEDAVSDYEQCFEALFDHVDYFTVNVSSPNTPNLRALQDKEPLTKLLLALQALNNQKATPKPILLKIAPDLTDSQLDDIIEIAETTGIAGVIATNTTISRANLKSSENMVENIGAGGLSGKPLTKRSTEVIRYLYEKSGKKLKIIGVGGIHSAADAIEKLEAGACLVQVYTGFIYEGPNLVKEINKALIKYYKSKKN
ncbi:quinone-dependent dihydroorotate dehydrogenase [Limibacter armeniacum]|uniref:quinone-dependent dihydroorotate dehydrogenase n=1 Tax=Limibacter armeniacum TaxID=466084 RepID=UPI002FE6B3A5